VVQDETGWLVPGFMSLRRLESLVARTLEEPEDIESIGGLIAHLSDGDVTTGTSITWDGITMIVEQVEDGRATRVRVHRPPKRR